MDCNGVNVTWTGEEIEWLEKRIATLEAFVRAADDWLCDYHGLGAGTTATALRKARAAVGEVGK